MSRILDYYILLIGLKKFGVNVLKSNVAKLSTILISSSNEKSFFCEDAMKNFLQIQDHSAEKIPQATILYYFIKKLIGFLYGLKIMDT